MTHLPCSYSTSVSCRLEWRPSRWLLAAICIAGILASFSVLLSNMPRLLAWPLAACVLLHAARLALRESRLPACSLVFPGSELPVLVDGVPVEQVDVQWRGPLAFVSWQDRTGKRRRLSWWPDTLVLGRRRELRLAAGSLQASRHALAMAP